MNVDPNINLLIYDTLNIDNNIVAVSDTNVWNKVWKIARHSLAPDFTITEAIYEEIDNE